MTSRAVWTIGFGQCVSWGVLYYAFGVLVVPLEEHLSVPRWTVTGAFSLALLMSALAAPVVGRWTDRGRGPAVMQAGGLIAAVLLALWAAWPTIWTSYIAWAGLGLCMAAVLYEPVFAQVGRVVSDSRERIRAIATITVLGGLASTVALPATAWLVELAGWRAAVLILASVLAVVTVLVDRLGFLRAPPVTVEKSDSPLFVATDSPARLGPSLATLTVTFACASFVSAALATNLVPALIDRRLSPTSAATVAGLFGVMQLPGRLLVMNRRFSLGPTQLVWASLGLQVAGLSVLTVAQTHWPIIAAVSLFACGSGLVTLARPYVVLTVYGPGQAGHINGRIARVQQLARAAGPVVVTALATRLGYGAVFASLAAMLLALLALAASSRQSMSFCRAQH